MAMSKRRHRDGGASDGSKKRKARSADRPLSALEQIRTLQPRYGEKEWYLQRQERHAGSAAERKRGSVVLPKSLLQRRVPISLAPHVPDEAPIFPGGPRVVGHEHPRPLRRFRGTKVLPAQNFTQIYNGDNRQVYSDSSYPWVCIGRLNKPDGSWGTAALVGRRIVLTASHVVSGWWSPGNPVVGGLAFVPASFDGTSILGSGWSAPIVNIAAWEDTTAQDGYDMAICQLDRPMGDWLGFFGCRTYDGDWEDMSVWTHAGYPYDKSMGGVRPTFELGISVVDDDSDSYDTLEVETKADIGSGQSGGPLWAVFSGGQRQIIGTLSGREDNFGEPKNSLFAGGNGLVSLVRWGRDNYD